MSIVSRLFNFFNFILVSIFEFIVSSFSVFKRCRNGNPFLANMEQIISRGQVLRYKAVMQIATVLGQFVRLHMSARARVRSCFSFAVFFF